MIVLFSIFIPVFLAIFAMQMEKFESFSIRRSVSNATSSEPDSVPDVSPEN